MLVRRPPQPTTRNFSLINVSHHWFNNMQFSTLKLHLPQNRNCDCSLTVHDGKVKQGWWKHGIVTWQLLWYKDISANLYYIYSSKCYTLHQVFALWTSHGYQILFFSYCMVLFFCNGRVERSWKCNTSNIIIILSESLPNSGALL